MSLKCTSTAFSLLVMFVTVARAADSPMPTGEGQFAREAELKLLQSLHKKINVEWKNVTLESVLNQIATEAAIPIWINKQALSDDGTSLDQLVDLSLGEVTVWQSLRFLFRPLALTWLAQEGVLEVTTDANANDRLLTRTYDVSAITAVLEPQLEGNVRELFSPSLPHELRAEATLKRLMQDCFEDFFDAFPNQAAIVAIQGRLIVRTHYQKHLRVQSLLRSIEKILVRGVKTKSLDDKRPGYPYDEDAAIFQRFVELKSINVENAPLEEVLQALAKSNGIRLRIDVAAMNDEGLPRDQKVSLTLTETPLKGVLKHLLHPLGLTVVVDEGTLIVTTQAKANEAYWDGLGYSIVVHNISDITSSSPMALANAIERCTPFRWMPLFTGGYACPLGSHLLVIAQVQRGQIQVAELLDDLRKMPGSGMESSGAQMRERIYSLNDPSAIPDLVRSLPELIPNWDAKNGTIHRLGQCLTIRQSPSVHRRVSEIIGSLNAVAARPNGSTPMPINLQSQ